ncbi:MAG: S41 family peptidase [Acidobacteriota bacterium]|nr:S41 family peptidase [Acidobacteriota bacterium]
MKKHRGALARLFAVAIFLSATNFAFAQTESTPQIRLKTFDKVWKTVNEKFFDPNFGGVDWQAVHERYAPLVANVKTDAELHALLNRMLDEIKTSHLDVIAPETVARLRQPPVTVGLSMREVDNQVVITRLIEDSSAAKAGLKTGFVIIKVDGEAVKNLADAQARIAGVANTNVRLSFLDEKDNLREAVLERLSSNDAEKANVGGGISLYIHFESKRLTENIGYIRFDNFVAYLNPKIQAAIVSMKDAPGIIIDLRGNGGGDDSVAVKMAGLLFDKETQLMITKKRSRDDFYYKARPQKNPYLGKIVILVDERSSSASEQFAAGMQEARRAVVIGKTTRGSDLDANLAKLPTGAYMIYAVGQPHTPKGVVIEGRGVVPNIEVGLTRESLLAGRDAQLEAAIEYIKKDKQ